MSWITIGWALVAAFLINAIRWGWFKRTEPEGDLSASAGFCIFFLIFAVCSLAVGGLHHWHEVSEKPIKEKYTWTLFFQEGNTYYFLYKEKPDAKGISVYQSTDPKAHPKRIVKTRNYYGYTEEQVDFGTAKIVP